MQVDEAIALFKNSALKQLAVKDDVTSVLGYINLGVLEIHKRFPLWEVEAIITQAAGIDTYRLNGTDPNVAIDLSDHSLIVIETVYDEDGLEYAINNDKKEYYIHMPKFDTLKVVTIEPGAEMTAVYRASPKFVTEQDDEIPLPIQFIDPLSLYVAYKAQVSIKSGANEENNTHFQRFIASCNQVDLQGLIPQRGLETDKFNKRGFV